jgi:outer membrane protein assembly factor BamB
MTVPSALRAGASGGTMVKIAVVVCCLVSAPVEAFAQAPLLWELQEDIKGGVDIAQAITLSGKTAVVVGNAGVPLEGTDESDLVIQALGRTTGAIQWSDQTFLSIGVIEPLFVATRQHRAYVVGTLREPNDVRSAFLLSAYDVRTGALLWQNVWHIGQGVDVDHPTGVFATPTLVLVVGYSENETRDGLATVVRAFDPLSGDIVWEDRVGSTGVDQLGRAIAANRNRVFVAGSIASASDPSPPDLFVRAHDARSGNVVWEITRPSVSVTKLVLASQRVLIAGSSALNTYLAAFSAATGALIWQDTVPTAGVVADIAVDGSRIAAGINSGSQLVIRSYDLGTGAVEWENISAAGPGLFNRVVAVAINREAVFATGTSGQVFGNSDFLVQAYDARSGLVLWEDHSHSSSQTAAVDLALGRSRLFVAGYTTDSSTLRDFLVRAYDIRPNTPATH